MKGFCWIVGMVIPVAVLGAAGIGSVAAQQPGGEWEALAAGQPSF